MAVLSSGNEYRQMVVLLRKR